MGDPAGPGKQYCTSCGELIDRESTYCTYCGAETTDRAFPTERSGPATASDSRSLGTSTDTKRGEPPGAANSGGERPPAEKDHDTPRMGAEPVGDSAPEESTWRTVGVATGLGILGVVLLAVFSAIGGALLFSLALPELAVLGIATAVGQYLGFVGLGLWYLNRRGYDRDRILSYLGVRAPSLRELGLVVAGWVTILVLIIIVSIVVQAFLPEPAQNEGAAAFAEGSTELWMLGAGVAFMFLVVGPCEEFLYRGIVQNRLRERLSAVPAILLASVVFASVHVVALSGGDPLAMATTVGILFVPAIVLGAVYEYTRNLVVPSLLHGLHNSVILAIVFFGPELEEAAGSAEFVSTLLSLAPF